MQTTRINYTHPDPRRAATTARLAQQPQRQVVRLTAANPTTVIRTGR